MFSNRNGMVHESVADVLGEIGVRSKESASRTNKANNSQFLAEGVRPQKRQPVNEAGYGNPHSYECPECGTKGKKGGKCPKNGCPGKMEEMTSEGEDPHAAALARKNGEKNTGKQPQKEEDEDPHAAALARKNGKGKGKVNEGDYPQGHQDAAGRMKPDETDGEPNTSTTVGMRTNTKVNTDPKNTDTKADVDAGKPSAADEGKGGDGEPINEEQVDEAVTAFFESLQKPVTMMIWEGKDGKEEVEFFGLTKEDLAPFGGTCPAVPQRYMKKAREGQDKTKGAAGALMIYSRQGLDNGTLKLLSGPNLPATGWAAPKKGTGVSAK